MNCDLSACLSHMVSNILYWLFPLQTLKVTTASEDQTMQLYNLENIELLRDPVTNTKALVAWNQDTIVISFRGTANKQNALHDLQVSSMPQPQEISRFGTLTLSHLFKRRSGLWSPCLTTRLPVVTVQEVLAWHVEHQVVQTCRPQAFERLLAILHLDFLPCQLKTALGSNMAHPWACFQTAVEKCSIAYFAIGLNMLALAGLVNRLVMGNQQSRKGEPKSGFEIWHIQGISSFLRKRFWSMSVEMQKVITVMAYI